MFACVVGQISCEVLLDKEERLARKESAIVKVHCDIVAECFIAVYEWCIDIGSALCMYQHSHDYAYTQATPRSKIWVPSHTCTHAL